MRSATGPRFAMTFALDVAIALGVAGSAATTILITEYHVGSGELTYAQRRLLDDGTRAPPITTIKINNNDTSRKPKELRQWPMLH